MISGARKDSVPENSDEAATISTSNSDDDDIPEDDRLVCRSPPFIADTTVTLVGCIFILFSFVVDGWMDEGIVAPSTALLYPSFL